MSTDTFLRALQEEVEKFSEAIATDQGDWIVKGFIDVYRHIYAMPGDTKVVSKVLELLLIPRLVHFAKSIGYSIKLASQQNFYPDVSFISRSTGEMYAVDIKSTYRTSKEAVNGMTLGAFTGYFRNRQSMKNTMFPYIAYQAHLVLGVIYSKIEFEETDQAVIPIDEGIVPSEEKIYSLDDLEKIRSVVREFAFFVQPKYKIATARPGSGNTRNIGSVTNIVQLVDGAGPFAELGEEVYDDYWMNYLNKDMARKAETVVPYYNLRTYAEYKNRGMGIDIEKARQLDQIDTGPGKEVKE